VFDDEINRIAAEVGSRKKAFRLTKADHKLVRFYLPLVPDDPEQPVWSVIRKLADKIGEGVTTHMRAIARENPQLQVEQAFFALVHLAYLQAFEDVNKRVSRLAANIPLIRGNLCPLSFVDVPERDLVVGRSSVASGPISYLHAQFLHGSALY
jgi:hypothetical protein